MKVSNAVVVTNLSPASVSVYKIAIIIRIDIYNYMASFGGISLEPNSGNDGNKIPELKIPNPNHWLLATMVTMVTKNPDFTNNSRNNTLYDNLALHTPI